MSETVKPQTAEEVLKALLSTTDVVEDFVHMKRFGVDFKIRAIDGDVINQMQERCTYYTGKGTKRTREIDEQLFGALVIQRACIQPNWGDAQLLSKYQTSDPVDVIRKRLLAGEISKLSAAILDLSGFDDEEENDVKN